MVLKVVKYWSDERGGRAKTKAKTALIGRRDENFWMDIKPKFGSENPFCPLGISFGGGFFHVLQSTMSNCQWNGKLWWITINHPKSSFCLPSMTYTFQCNLIYWRSCWKQLAWQDLSEQKRGGNLKLFHIAGYILAPQAAAALMIKLLRLWEVMPGMRANFSMSTVIMNEEGGTEEGGGGKENFSSPPLCPSKTFHG